MLHALETTYTEGGARTATFASKDTSTISGSPRLPACRSETKPPEGLSLPGNCPTGFNPARARKQRSADRRARGAGGSVNKDVDRCAKEIGNDRPTIPIAIPQADLDDLRERLARTRWIDEVEGSGWIYGIDLGYLRELADYWQHTYDWRTHEAALNRFAHFKADVDGVGIHFIQERGKGPNPTPLLLIHGFPDSFYRYHKVIDRLTDPAKYGGDPRHSFDVIVPSIPGTGFSDRITRDDDVNADLFAKLMTEVLGYERFVSAGGDHGAIITQSLARRYPELLIGIHLTDVGYPDANTDFSKLSPAEMEMASWVQQWFMEEGIGVNMIMATKPQTLAYGLNDSPVGLAAWIISYSSSGQKGKEEFKTRFSADELLTNVTSIG
jgi:pimeloyl-ACP methyl ester carboxylesterase